MTRFAPARTGGLIGSSLGPPATQRLVLAAGMASLLDSAAIITVGNALPVWRSELDLSDWNVGTISSSFTLFIAIGALLGGRAADKLGRSRVFAATVGFYALGAAVLSTARSPTAIVSGVVILGVASGADLPASIALVAERSPAHIRARMVALTHVMWTVGILLATAAALAVSTLELLGIRVLFASLVITALATLAVRRRVTRSVTADPLTRSGETPPVRLDSPDGVHRRRQLLALVAAFYLVYTLVSNTFGSFRTYFLVVVGGATQTTATAIAFGVTGVGLAGSLVFSVIAESPWRRRVFPYGAMLLVGAQVVLAVDAGQTLLRVTVALVMYSLAYPFIGEALYKVWSQELVASDLRATFQGATIALARGGAAVFALFTPTLMSWSSAGLFWLLAAFATLACVIGWIITLATRSTHAA